MEHLVNECPGAEDTGIFHHGQTLGGNMLHQGLEICIPHFGGDGGIPQQAAVHRQSGVQGV